MLRTRSCYLTELSNRTLILSLLIGACICFCEIPRVSGQFGNQVRLNEDVVLFAPRALTRLLREGERALEEERYADGISALGMLFDDQERALPDDIRGQDYFMETPFLGNNQPGRLGYYQKTLKGEALRLLSSLPKDGRELLEIEYGVAARQELEQALSTADFFAIAEVARRYPFTFAGYDAQVLAAQAMFTRGSPLAAAAIYQRLMDYPAARQRYGTALPKAAAICWVTAGMDDAAVKALEFASQSYSEQSIELAGQQLSLSATTDWNSAIRSLKAMDRSQVMVPIPEQWMLAGGSATRQSEVVTSMPIANPRWIAKTHSSVPEKNAILNLATAEEDGDRVILPKAEIRAVGDLILVKTTDAEILAVDLKTGLTKWVYYENSAPADLLTPSFSRNGRNATSSISDQLKNRVWGSSAYGRFSCDEQYVYCVTDGKSNVAVASRSRRSIPYSNANQLQAISLSREGALEWVVGAPIDNNPNTVSHLDLANAYFLGPPLSYEGHLFCIAEFNGDTRLVVLDAATGNLLWWQQLCSTSSQSWQSQAGRKSQAISPTISDGVVVCPTGMGAVAAVDLLTRRLNWLVSYGSNEAMVGQFRGGALSPSADFDPLAERWNDNAVIAKDGYVVVSPVEEDMYFVRNLLTGQPVLGRRKRDFGRYVAGIHDGRIVIVGKRNISCLDIDSQSIVWDNEFPDGCLLAGKGLWLQDSVIVPLTGNKLVRYDVSDGSQVETADVDQPLGNLFVHRGNLISVSATDVSVYFTRDELRQSVRERLAENSNDTEALNQKAQLAYAMGEIDQAFETLGKSFELDSENPETVSMMVEILLAGLESDFQKYESIALELRPLVEDHPKRVRFLQWLALGSLKADKYEEAFGNLLAFMRERVSQSRAISSNRALELRISDSYSVDADAWIATELARCYALAGPEQRRAMEEMVEEELSRMSELVLSQRQLKLRYLAWHPSAESSIVEAAILLSQQDRQVASEEMLLPLLYSPNPDSMNLAKKLLGRWTSEDLSVFGPRGQFLSSMYDGRGQFTIPEMELEEQAANPKQAIDWKSGKVLFTAIRERGIYPRGNRLPCLSERFGRPPIDVRMSADEIILANANGETPNSLRYSRASSDNNSMFNRCYIRGGLLIVETSSEVVGMDMYLGLENPRDALLWRRSMLTPSAAPRQRFSQTSPNTVETSFGVEIIQRETAGKTSSVGPLTPGGLLLQKGISLLSIDPYSGHTLWTRDGYPESVRLASENLQIAVLNPATGAVQYLDCRDGAELSEAELEMSEKDEQAPNGDTSSYGQDWKKWYSYGSTLVEYKEKQAADLAQGAAVIAGRNTRRPILRVWDAFASRPLAVLDQLPLNSRAASCEDRFLVIADQRQKLHYFDLESKTYQVWDTPVDEDLQSIAIARFGGRLMVLSNGVKSNAELTELTQRNRIVPQEFHEVHGRVYAIDIDKQELCWKQPAELYGMYMPVNQPRSAPFMITYRFNPRRAGESTVLSLLDLRDGSLAYANRRVPVDILGGFAMLLHPRTQLIEMSLGNRNFVFRCTDQEKPPQPIARFGHILADQEPNRLKGFDIFK